MSIELIDLRAKVDELTDAVLTVEQQDSGKDRSGLVREILHDWAASKSRKATLLCNALISKGIVRDVKGS